MSEVSGNELAKLTGKSWRTVRGSLEAAGIKPLRIECSSHLFASVVSLPAIYTNQEAPGEDLDLNAERARLARMQADKIEIEIAARACELLEASTVERAWARLI